MNDYQELKDAYSRPAINLKTLTDVEGIARALSDTNTQYVSEWKETIGQLKYSYHTHSEEEGKRLKELLNCKKKGGNPWLEKVLSRKELEAILEKNCVHS